MPANSRAYSEVAYAAQVIEALAGIDPNDDFKATLTDDEEAAWKAAAGVAAVARQFVPDDAGGIFAIVDALIAVGMDFHRFVAAGREVVVKAKEAMIVIGPLGDDVIFGRLE